jgi:hypothetical protein
LEHQLYNLLNATHCLFNLMNPQLVGDCWLCLSPGPLHYVVSMVSPLNQSICDATPNSTSTKPKVSNIQLSQRAPNCTYNLRGYSTVGELAASQCAQIQNSVATAIRCTVDTDHGVSAQESSLYAGPLLISACHLTERAYAH